MIGAICDFRHHISGNPQNQAKSVIWRLKIMQEYRKSKSRQNEMQEQGAQFCHGYQQSKHIKKCFRKKIGSKT